MFGRRRKKDSEPEVDERDVLATDEDDADDADESSGPFDSDDAPEDEVARLDLGSLRVPTLPGVEARMQTDDQGNVKQILLVNGESGLQLGVFAAPRTAGIWDEVREEIASSVEKQGGNVETVEDGPFGVELLVHPAGQNNAAVRFVGIDGPRWFVRGLFQGRRAVDVDAAPALDETLRGVVVERGAGAMPVREGLPLRLPAKMAEEAKARVAAAKQSNATGQTPAASSPGTAGASGVNGSARTAKRKPSPRPKKR